MMRVGLLQNDASRYPPQTVGAGSSQEEEKDEVAFDTEDYSTRGEDRRVDKREAGSSAREHHSLLGTYAVVVVGIETSMAKETKRFDWPKVW